MDSPLLIAAILFYLLVLVPAFAVRRLARNQTVRAVAKHAARHAAGHAVGKLLK